MQIVIERQGIEMKIAVLVSGGGTNLEAILTSIEEKKITNATVSVVISNKKDAYALVRAKNHNVEGICISPKEYESRSEFGHAMVEELKRREIELVVLAGYLVILPVELIKAYENKIINIHPSLIPSFCGAGYYGLKVHEEVLKRGCKVTGATVHYVDEGTDTGPIILQQAVNILEEDTKETLQRRVMEEAEWRILPKAIDLIANDQIQVVNGHVIRK